MPNPEPSNAARMLVAIDQPRNQLQLFVQDDSVSVTVSLKKPQVLLLINELSEKSLHIYDNTSN